MRRFFIWRGQIALLAVIGFCTPVHAATCAERGAVIARLAKAYGETRQSIGLATNDTVIEVFASSETGTWTITATTPTGTTCLIASGLAFENLSEAPIREGDPT